MNTNDVAVDKDPEFAALTTVHDALKGLNREAQERVVDYVMRKLGLSQRTNTRADDVPSVTPDYSSGTGQTPARHKQEPDEDGLDGVSPVAQKWMKRNSLDASQLSSLFSLGTDEIDLVAKTVPGDSKNARTKNVAILKSIAAYLSTGAARVTHDQLKEACLHYDAYDSPNHAKYLRGMTAELSGSKESGYSLTARGLTTATDLIREMLAGKAK